MSAPMAHGQSSIMMDHGPGWERRGNHRCMDLGTYSMARLAEMLRPSERYASGQVKRREASHGRGHWCKQAWDGFRAFG